jgi:Xaa-Pro aminopeptidase
VSQRLLRPIWAVAFIAASFAPHLPAQVTEPTAEYRARRETLRAKLGDGIAVLFGNTEGEGSESYFAFHQESNFYYLSGWTRPGAVLLVAAGSGEEDGAALPREILFLPARDPREEAWTGPQLDPADAATAGRIGFDAVRDIGKLDEELRRYSRLYETVYTLLPPQRASEDEQALHRSRAERIRKAFPAAKLEEIRRPLAGLRQLKSAEEIARIRRAVECSLDAHLAAGRAVAPGLAEYEIAALMKYEFERRGCTNTAFHPIIGSGIRSTILHYTSNTERMEAGSLVVLDVGAEYGDYSADITRTLPVSGKFTPRQREIYEIVLGAQKAVLAAVKPGMRLGRGENSLHQIAVDYLNSHGKDKHGQPLGKYFIHGIGHGIGLDVHDPIDGLLQPGMALAIEPGLYIPEENIGVRIEDNVLVTETGSEHLSARLPREPDEIERWMAQSVASPK